MPLINPACAGNKVLSFMLLASVGIGASSALAEITALNSGPTMQQTVSDKQVDSDLKLLLNDYYSGKPVRAKVVIPANERGIEVVDGQLKSYPLPDLTVAVQPGELLLIKELRFKNKEIEVRFNSEHLNEIVNATPIAPVLAPIGPHGSDATVGLPKATPPSKKAKPPKSLPDPRVILRFSRDIETRDLNLQSINRLLSSAIDVASLTPDNTLKVTEPPPRPNANERAQQVAAEQGIPIAKVTGNLIGAPLNVGELVIECAVSGARLYIDGTYSGTAPRTVQLLMGVHTVLVVAPGHPQFEQKFFLPAGKIAFIKADMQSPKQ